QDDLFTFGKDAPKPVRKGATLVTPNIPNSESSVGHGTHVAGIVGGRGTAGSGYYTGVAPGANLIGIGTGDVLFIFFALAGFDYILDHQQQYNIKVVNNSWGTTGTFDPKDPINEATKKLSNRGITVVFAAGNEGPGENTLNPYSAAPWVISVAAGCKLYVADPTNSESHCMLDDGSDPLVPTDNEPRAHVLADFSSRGIAGDPLYHPDITAPGVHIVSTRAATGTVLNGSDANHDIRICNIAALNQPFYTCASGTSMASPHIAGVVALMQEAAGGKLSPSQVLNALTSTARPLTGYGTWEVGAGFVDAYAAVMKVKK
ncbi:MAG TPA: S8 family serine peptidase, partial [Gemmatimonadales bacterium]|nr:S8 family serine peptidase [Gemmatimonadales bacterium]